MSAVFSILYFILRILLHMITAERDEGWVERLTQFPRHPPTPNLQPGGDSGVDIYHLDDDHHSDSGDDIIYKLPITKQILVER